MIELQVTEDAPIELNALSDEPVTLGVSEQIVATYADLSPELKQAFLNLAEHIAYIDEDGQDYYNALFNALYPVEPPAELDYITAVYTQSGTVYSTDSLDSLKDDLVVTAHNSDSTTETVTTYTLSGTLAEGTSTITVSYGGKTTTFSVTVTAYYYPMTVQSTDAGVGWGSVDSTKNTASTPYLANTQKNRIHAIGDNTGYPVNYGHSYKITITGSLGTEGLSVEAFNAAGKELLQNTQSAGSSYKVIVTGAWIPLDGANTFTFTPPLVNGTEPVCMWIVFRKNASNQTWSSLSDLMPFTIEEI